MVGSYLPRETMQNPLSFRCITTAKLVVFYLLFVSVVDLFSNYLVFYIFVNCHIYRKKITVGDWSHNHSIGHMFQKCLYRSELLRFHLTLSDMIFESM